MMVYRGVNEGRISIAQFVDIVATRPARTFGLYPRKGVIAIGSDADIVIWDPERASQSPMTKLHHAVDYTNYEGMRGAWRASHRAAARQGHCRGPRLVGVPGEGVSFAATNMSRAPVSRRDAPG